MYTNLKLTAMVKLTVSGKKNGNPSSRAKCIKFLTLGFWRSRNNQLLIWTISMHAWMKNSITHLVLWTKTQCIITSTTGSETYAVSGRRNERREKTGHQSARKQHGKPYWTSLELRTSDGTRENEENTWSSEKPLTCWTSWQTKGLTIG